MGQSFLYDRLVAKDLLKASREDLLPTSGASAGVELVAAADVLISHLLWKSGPVLLRYERPLRALVRLGRLRRAGACAAGAAGLVASAVGPIRSHKRVRGNVDEMASRAGGYESIRYEQQPPRNAHGKPLAGHLFVFAR